MLPTRFVTEAALAGEEDPSRRSSDQTLLRTFAERYDGLLSKYAALQAQCREEEEKRRAAEATAQTFCKIPLGLISCGSAGRDHSSSICAILLVSPKYWVRSKQDVKDGLNETRRPTLH